MYCTPADQSMPLAICRQTRVGSPVLTTLDPPLHPVYSPVTVEWRESSRLNRRRINCSMTDWLGDDGMKVQKPRSSRAVAAVGGGIISLKNVGSPRKSRAFETQTQTKTVGD